MKKYLLTIAFFACCYLSFAQTVNVATSTQLQSALNAAVAGQTIVMADGVYDLPSGLFTPPIGVNGTASAPITLQGSRNAVLTTGTYITGYGFQFKGNKYWVLKGFTTRNCKNGIMVDSSQYITIDSVQSVYTGQAGINLRRYSSYCTVKNCYIDSSGMLDAAYGEGIYIGSAYENWCTNTYCNVDTCNYNKILSNRFGNYVRAENVDIKEGTKYGLVRGNIFNGTGLANVNGGDSWIDVKGNYYTIELNTGTNSYLDGFQTHIQQPGWGNYNTFNQNTLNVNASGYGIRVATSNSNGTALNNVVCNSNTVSGAALGLANIATQTCSAVLASELLNWNVLQQNGQLVFSWRITDVSQLKNFIIEHSADGNNFSTRSVVDVAGLSYAVNLQSASKYFRLLLNKKDGGKTYSTIIHINTINANNHQVFKANNALVVVSSSPATIRLINLQGQLLFTANANAGASYFYPKLTTKGMYVVEINNAASAEKFHQKIFW